MIQAPRRHTKLLVLAYCQRDLADGLRAIDELADPLAACTSGFLLANDTARFELTKSAKGGG